VAGAAAFGAGVRIYATPRMGFTAEALGLRFPRSTFVVPSFGVFLQSR
jgi:hypothetical protein